MTALNHETDRQVNGPKVLCNAFTGEVKHYVQYGIVGWLLRLLERRGMKRASRASYLRGIFQARGRQK